MTSIAGTILDTSNMFSEKFDEDRSGSVTVEYVPTEIMSGRITPEPPMEFSNYDVLLMPSEANEPVLFAPGNHIGNQRFRVFLKIYRQSYLQARDKGDDDECARIAREVMYTVYHKCVPNGRFYEKGRDNQWTELHIGPSTLALIKSALENEPKESLPEERPPKRFCRHGSIVSTGSEDEAVTKPGRFDVVFKANGMKLEEGSDYTGNNRLKVMLDLRSDNYKKANNKVRQEIAQEVVSSIVDDASSQFLRSDGASDTHRPVPRESAEVCIQKLLDGMSEGKKKAYRQAEVKKLMDRRKKKQVLGKLERRNKGKKGKMPSKPSSPSTTFKAFQMSTAMPELPRLQAAI